MSNELFTSRLLLTPPLKKINGSEAEWRVIHDGQEIGPLSQDSLVEMAETGHIEQADLVKKGDGEWAKARDVDILRRQFSRTSAQQRERTPLEALLETMVRFQTHLAVGFFVLVILIGVGVGVVGSISRERTDPNSVAGTTWQGSENLAKFGYLAFDFRSDGTVIMTDAARHVQGNVHGHWSQQGSEVTITFTNCQYQGTMQNSSITGLATFRQTGKRWTFSVSKR